jgi:hypothetical protein
MRRNSPFTTEPTRRPSSHSRQSSADTHTSGHRFWHDTASDKPAPSLQGLKQSVYSVWVSIAQVEGEDIVESSPLTDVVFKKEIHESFGDLRKKATWHLAFATLWAKFLVATNDSNVALIRTFVKNSIPSWELLSPSVLDAFLYGYDQSIVCLRNGIERILNMPEHKSLIPEFFNVLQKTRAFREPRFQFSQSALPSAA